MSTTDASLSADTRPQLIATCPKGLESLLLEELQQLGTEECRETVGSVYFRADMRGAYRACLWSRLANRILLVFSEFHCPDADALYQGVKAIDWDEHLLAEGSLAIDFSGTSRALNNSHFSALKCKDAICDWFLDRGDTRPEVNKQRPDVRLNVRLRKGYATLALDLSGESLHRRGYRQQGALAPLKENLAAALLMRANWPGIAARGGALIDPMCGSGTLLIEGAMMAMNIAPNTMRRHWGFSNWLGHVPALWKPLIEEAKNLRAAAFARQWPEIRGYDASGKVVAVAEENIDRAGLRGRVRVLRKELVDFTKPTHTQIDTGLVIANPPYGERLGDEVSLVHLYRYLGQALQRDFCGWRAAMITGNPELGKRMGIRSHKQYQFYNGSIEAKLLLFDVQENAFVNDPRNAADANGGENAEAELKPASLNAGAQMFANRLQKNQKRMAKWLKREDIQCYRLYDADIPEYAVAVDRYGDYLHVAEYVAPASVSEDTARARLRDVLEALPVATGIAPERIVLKERRRQQGKAQYQKVDQRKEQLEVREGQAKLLVNLHDYLDTGLFLDHRPVRLDIAQRAKGKTFLNLYCYTGTASVHAALGGARYTTSVDLSNTYLSWARQNLSLNGLSESRHRTDRADCQQWLRDCDKQFDLILLDPPSFSNSKKTEGVLDVQRDHAELIELAMGCLSPGGTLIFSNNRRGFKLDAELFERYSVKDRTRWSLDEDFSRRSRPIHQCWYIEQAPRES